MSGAQESDRFVWLIAFCSVLLGSVVLFGWIANIPELVRISPEWNPMAPSAAICFLFSGLGVTLARPGGGARLLGLHILFAGLVVLISSARVLELAFDVPLKSGYLALGWLMPPEIMGQMAPQTATCFLLFSIGTLLNRWRRNSRLLMLCVRVMACILISVGVSVLLGYTFKLFYLFEDLYFKTGLVWMSFPTAGGMVLLGVGLWNLSTAHLQNMEAGVDRSSFGVSRIYHTTIAVVAVTLVTASLVGLASLDDAIQRQSATSMLQTLDTRRAFVETVLDNRTQRALVASLESQLNGAAKSVFERQAGGDEDAVEFAEGLLSYGFTAVAVDGPGRRKLLSGKLTRAEAFSVRLQGPNEVFLVWDNAYYLRMLVPLHRDEKGLPDGYLVTEQSLPRLDTAFTEANLWGETGAMPMCFRQSASELSCFPQRDQARPFKVMDHINGKPLPATLALAGKSGIAMTADYRGRNVLAAYGRVGTTGLGLVLKMDVAEVYAPVKRQLLYVYPWFIVLAGVGFLLIRLRVRPLVQDLAQAHAAERMERARFTAAMESSPDVFMIYDSVVNETGDVVDLRIAYLNQNARDTPELAGDRIGRTFKELFPTYLETFAAYQKVLSTGQMLVEEFCISAPNQQARWYQRQAVAMPGGIATTLKNITREKLLYEQVAESNLLRTAIVESAAYAIISTDVNGTILTFNKAAERMLWYSAQDLVGKSTPGLLHDMEEVVNHAKALTEELGFAVAPGFDAFVAKTKINLHEEREWTYIRKDGSRFPVLLSVTALRDNDGGLHGFLGIAHDISAQKRADEYIRHIALHDVLTGLPNRALLEDRIKGAIERQRRNEIPFALIMMDIDRFKQVNDSMGHHIGDKLLKEFVGRVSGCLRPTDTLARMGGDEFVVLLTESDDGGARLVAERIAEALIPPLDVGLQELHITSSMGISTAPRDGKDMNELMRCADVAMYWVKEHGRNGYKVFSPEMDHGATERLHLERDLHHALDTGEFTLFYQPQADLKSKTIFGVEALLRWRKPDGQHVSPATFIPLAEETGLIVPIGEWVLKTACRDAARISQALGSAVKVAVNISPRQFMNGDLVNLVQDTLVESRLAPGLLELEITEGVLMDERSGVATALLELSDLGVSIAIDDFGTGYSSLSYLKRFPISKIKIDQAFVRDVISDPDDAALAVAIIAMGHSLRIPVIAEGIETAEQLAFLRANHCDEGQGFFIGRPMPLDALLAWIGVAEHEWSSGLAALS